MLARKLKTSELDEENSELAPMYGTRDLRSRPALPTPAARHGLPFGLSAHPRRAQPRRQPGAQPGQFRHHLDGTRSRQVDDRVLWPQFHRRRRVPPDHRDPQPLRQHDRPALPRPRARRRRRLRHCGFLRGHPPGGLGPKVALATAAAQRRQTDRRPKHRFRRQRPGLLGEIRSLLGRRAAVRPSYAGTAT